jgi:hypothetical protein
VINPDRLELERQIIRFVVKLYPNARNAFTDRKYQDNQRSRLLAYLADELTTLGRTHEAEAKSLATESLRLSLNSELTGLDEARTSIAVALSASGAFRAAQEVACEIRNRNRARFVHSVIAKEASLQGKVDLAQTECHAVEGENSDGVIDDAVITNLLAARLNMNEIDDIFRMASSFADKEYQLWILSSLASALKARGDRAMFKRAMLEAAEATSDSKITRVSSLKAIVTLYALLGTPDQAVLEIEHAPVGNFEEVKAAVIELMDRGIEGELRARALAAFRKAWTHASSRADNNNMFSQWYIEASAAPVLNQAGLRDEAVSIANSCVLMFRELWR